MLCAKYDYETDLRVQKEESREDGIEEGISRYNLLVKKLVELGRLEEIKKMADDEDYRNQLFVELINEEVK